MKAAINKTVQAGVVLMLLVVSVVLSSCSLFETRPWWDKDVEFVIIDKVQPKL